MLNAAVSEATEGAPKKKANAPVQHVPEFVLPPNATLVGLDTGIRNVFGLAREDALESGFAYSAGRYYSETGIKRRQREHDFDFSKAAREDAAFSEASNSVAAACTKTHDSVLLLQALAARGVSFRSMYAVYGSEKLARHRFLNYQGSQRVLHKMVKLVAPNKSDIVVVGDADFGSKVRGHPPGIAGRFVSVLKQELGPSRMVWGDEFRSSCLDSVDKQRMYHPPKELAVNKRTGAKYVRRVYGLYQRSAPGVSRLWNRDVNAARNIVLNFRHVMEHGVMPEHFRREVEVDHPISCSYRWRVLPDGTFLRWRKPQILADPAEGAEVLSAS